MSSDRPHLFRIRRGWRTGGLVRLDHPSSLPGEASDHHAPETALPADQTRPAGRAWTGNHRIDLRVSIPLPTGRWYVTIVAGPERRSADRLRSEGQTHWLRQAVIYIMLMALLLWLAACVIAIVYLMKSALGIDLFEGNSPLHFLWEWAFESAVMSAASRSS